ncbi:MAG: 50S ribosomal protein L24 [Patescibacteria group bacterium]|nr:50S ribosomal protein L24 [Patescibacteria group bacterium]MDD5121044.1 50S ribosomal protein L24 [Patescibacteria group bacterium]MDD5221594.1 50S ribosomal protein L24 [Patescibacteria group bacterium]MDD5396037.1 50S ribosomal protein L24 [Patescibacteria group bacterium]
MKIKKGDMIQVLSGKDKGKKGRVLRVSAKTNKVVIEGINLFFKHVRPKREGEKGQRIQIPVPLYISKIAFLCPKCLKPARVGYKTLTDGSKVRSCKKCKEII